MKSRVLLLYLISLSTFFAFRGVGEEESASIRPLRFAAPPSESLNRFGLSCRMGMNVKTSFKYIGSFSSALPRPTPRVTPDGDQYNYDNGYVLPDAGTPNSDLTHYWGYQGFTYDGSSQLPGNGTILMQRASSSVLSHGFNSGNHEDDPLPGIELTYNRELGRSRHLRWGVEAAFNYMNVSVRDGHPLRGSANLHTDVLTDAYPLLVPETLLPPPGYEGRKNTPAVVIGATPQSSRQSSLSDMAVPEIVTGSREFDADIFGFRLGPYLEIPLSRKISLSLSGGLALAEINSDFRFTETIQAGSVVFPSTRGAGSHNEILPGGYLEGTVSCAVTRSASVFAGVQFQNLGHYTHRVNHKEAALDLSNSLFVNLGLSYTF
jgi:hypothetical protein